MLVEVKLSAILILEWPQTRMRKPSWIYSVRINESHFQLQRAISDDGQKALLEFLIHLPQVSASISDWAVLYNSNLFARFVRLCMIAGSSSNILPNTFAWNISFEIFIHKTIFIQAYMTIISIFQFHDFKCLEGMEKSSIFYFSTSDQKLQ